jgi:hypothetical protein
MELGSARDREGLHGGLHLERGQHVTCDGDVVGSDQLGNDIPHTTAMHEVGAKIEVRRVGQRPLVPGDRGRLERVREHPVAVEKNPGRGKARHDASFVDTITLNFALRATWRVGPTTADSVLR